MYGFPSPIMRGYANFSRDAADHGFTEGSYRRGHLGDHAELRVSLSILRQGIFPVPSSGISSRRIHTEETTGYIQGE